MARLAGFQITGLFLISFLMSFSCSEYSFSLGWFFNFLILLYFFDTVEGF